MIALGSAVLLPAAAAGKSLTDAEKEAIKQRLAPIEPYAAKMRLEAGGTIIVERTVDVPASRIKKKARDYEAFVTGIVAPDGIVVHQRMDEFEIVDAGPKKKVTFRYVVHAEANAKSGGRARVTLSLVERTGFANTAHQEKTTHWFDVGPANPTPEQLTADFWGYRFYAPRMKKSARMLRRKGLSKLSTQDNKRLPPLDRVAPKTAALAVRFTRYRMRVWSAHRHLVAALQSPNPQIASLARTYLSKLDDKSPSGLPNVAIVPGSGGGETVATAEVETLEPTRTEPVEPPPPPARVGGDGTLAPVGTYEAGSDRTGPESLPDSSRPRPEPDKTKPPSGPVVADASAPGGQPKVDGAASAETGGVVVNEGDDILGSRTRRRVTYIPSYFRSLTLDDPNIAHGGALRFAFATVQLNASAIASAMFFDGQIAITRFFGLEVTVPTEYVNVDLPRAPSVFVMGNPLLAAKWRLYLPKVEGRAPVVTLRGRWAVPVPPQHQIPLTDFIAEHFSREAHFADTYAFFLEKTAVGLGSSAAWQYDMFEFGLELYLDYYTPVEGAEERTSFMTLSYGASFGVLPWGDLVGFFAEARAVSLFAGPQRTEFFAYLGARGRFLDYLEPALWLGYPLGSVRNVSTLQVGAELRFSYDLQDIVESSTRVVRDDEIFE
ncbi:MAG: hypothetical protein RIT81_29690 [Deltaproteobacteria bacterium]